MGGQQGRLQALVPERVQDKVDRPGSGPPERPVERIDSGVAGEVNGPGVHAFLQECRLRAPGGREVETGRNADQLPVRLLGKRMREIIGTKPRFIVGYFDSILF
jgi:hypothetical protein